MQGTNANLVESVCWHRILQLAFANVIIESYRPVLDRASTTRCKLLSRLTFEYVSHSTALDVKADQTCEQNSISRYTYRFAQLRVNAKRLVEHHDRLVCVDRNPARLWSGMCMIA